MKTVKLVPSFCLKLNKSNGDVRRRQPSPRYPQLPPDQRESLYGENELSHIIRSQNLSYSEVLSSTFISLQSYSRTKHCWRFKSNINQQPSTSDTPRRPLNSLTFSSTTFPPFLLHSGAILNTFHGTWLSFGVCLS